MYSIFDHMPRSMITQIYYETVPFNLEKEVCVEIPNTTCKQVPYQVCTPTSYQAGPPYLTVRDLKQQCHQRRHFHCDFHLVLSNFTMKKSGLFLDPMTPVSISLREVSIDLFSNLMLQIVFSTENSWLEILINFIATISS